jgi:hypothetical protein
MPTTKCWDVAYLERGIISAPCNKLEQPAFAVSVHSSSSGMLSAGSRSERVSTFFCAHHTALQEARSSCGCEGSRIRHLTDVEKINVRPLSRGARRQVHPTPGADRRLTAAVTAEGANEQRNDARLAPVDDPCLAGAGRELEDGGMGKRWWVTHEIMSHRGGR